MIYNFAQTFYVHADRVKGAEYITVPKIEIYPTSYPSPNSKRAANLPDPGVSVSICEVDQNGYPMPDSEIRGAFQAMTRSGMLAARNRGWVTFQFQVPAILKTDKLYALLISTEADCDYRFGISRKNLTRAEKQAGLFIPGRYSDGKLFQLADGVPKELNGKDLQFRIYAAKHTQTSATFEVLNDNHEYLVMSNLSEATFIGDEIVYDANTSNHSFSNGTLTLGYLSTQVAGSGTSFLTDFQEGDVLIYTNAETQNDFEAYFDGSNTDVIVEFGVVTSITNDELLTLANEPSFDTSNGHYYLAPTARVYSESRSANKLVLYNSSASNATHRFSINSQIKGLDSGAYGKVAQVEDFEINRVTPELNTFVPAGTNVTFQVAFSNTSYFWSNNNSLSAEPEANTNLLTKGIVASRSNEVANSGVRGQMYQNDYTTLDVNYKYKSVKGTITLSTENEYSSPVLSEEFVDFFVYKNIVAASANTADESYGIGTDGSRYISKSVTLGQGLEAEDLRVYMTGYKPGGTDIRMFAKAQAAYDDEPLDLKPWTELVVKAVLSGAQTSPGVADSGIQAGYVEYEYGFDDKPTGNPDTEWTFLGFGQTVSGSSTFNITGGSTSNISNGDIVVLKNNDSLDAYHVSKVIGITDTGGTLETLTLETPVTNDTIVGPAISCYVVPAPFNGTVFNNTNNNRISRYWYDGIAYDAIKTFQIKIVLTSEDENVSPRVADFRAIAMSA